MTLIAMIIVTGCTIAGSLLFKKHLYLNICYYLVSNNYLHIWCGFNR